MKVIGEKVLGIAFKDFKAKKSRAAMCIIGVMVCVLLIGVVNSVLYAIDSSMQGDLGTIKGKLYFEKNGTNYPPFRSVISESIGNQVLNRSEVDPQKSTKALFAFSKGNTVNTAIMFVGLTPGKEQAFIQNNMVNGKNSLVGESENAVIIGSDTAKNYKVKVGDTFNISNDEFKVVGIMKKVSTGTSLYIDSSMIMSLSYAQKISDMQGLISTDIIVPRGNYSADAAINSLQDAYPKYTIYSQKDAQKTIDENLSQIRIFMNMISVFIFIVSMILIMNVMMMSVKEKTKEIGTMRAIGTKRRSIMALIMYESLILSVIGGLIGIVLMSPVYNILGIFMHMTDVSLISFTIPSTILVQLLVVIFVIGTFSGLLPAYLANRISPIEALRYE